MAYKLDPAEPIADAIGRMGLEQLDRVCRSLAGHEDPVTDIHEARKGLKRLRSVLRLVRTALAEGAYTAENIRLRDIGRSLAGMRDSHVIATRVEDLRRAPGGSTTAATAALTAFVAHLAAQACDRSAGARSEVIARASADLEAAREFWTRPLGADMRSETATRAALLAGMSKTYASIGSALAVARATECDERYHDARKAVQHHARHMGLLSPAWPDYFATRARAARDLAHVLGDHHDFSVLRTQAAGGGRGHHLTKSQAAIIERLCRAEQARLLLAADPVARRLLAATPRGLVREISAALDSCRQPAGAG